MYLWGSNTHPLGTNVYFFKGFCPSYSFWNFFGECMTSHSWPACCFPSPVCWQLHNPLVNWTQIMPVWTHIIHMCMCLYVHGMSILILLPTRFFFEFFFWCVILCSVWILSSRTHTQSLQIFDVLNDMAVSVLGCVLK